MSIEHRAIDMCTGVWVSFPDSLILMSCLDCVIIGKGIDDNCSGMEVCRRLCNTCIEYLDCEARTVHESLSVAVLVDHEYVTEIVQIDMCILLSQRQRYCNV